MDIIEKIKTKIMWMINYFNSWFTKWGCGKSRGANVNQIVLNTDPRCVRVRLFQFTFKLVMIFPNQSIYPCGITRSLLHFPSKSVVIQVKIFTPETVPRSLRRKTKFFRKLNTWKLTSSFHFVHVTQYPH